MMSESENEVEQWNFAEFFERKIASNADLNVPNEDGLYHLHDAAQYFNDDFAYFLISRGARLDVRCDCVGHKFHGFLPVDVALESLSRIVDWTPKESIFKLIVMFCLKKIAQPLATIKILVAYMEPKQIWDVICHYAEKGNLIEFAALLASVARARNIYSFTRDFGVESSSGRMETLSISIASKIVSLIDEEQKAMIRKNIKLADICKEKQRLILYRIMLLEIYERIGDVIGNCLSAADTDFGDLAYKMGATIAYNIKKEGFPLTDEHLQVFKRPEWQIELDEVAEKFQAKQCGYNLQKRDPAFPLILQLDNPLITKKKSTGRPLKQQLRSFSTHSWHGKTGSFSTVQSFHLQGFKTSASLEVCTNMEAQSKKTFQVIKRQVLDLLLNKGVSTFSLVIRRATGRA